MDRRGRAGQGEMLTRTGHVYQAQEESAFSRYSICGVRWSSSVGVGNEVHGLRLSTRRPVVIIF